ERARAMRVAAPEAPDVVAEAVVPLGPARREAADLVAARRVPGLGDQLDVAEHRVLGDPLEERGPREERSLGATRERRGEVEAEAVDADVQREMAEAFEDEVLHDRLVRGDRVA